MESIGQRINKLRKEKSLSQEYIAEQIGVTRQAVSKWENDTSAPDTYNLIALAELFNVSVEYIATGKTEEPSLTVTQPQTIQIATEKEKMPQIVKQPQIKSSGITACQIAGFILLSIGLLSFIVGLMVFLPLILFSVYLTVSGIICIAVKKRTVIALLCGLIITSVIIMILILFSIRITV